MVQAAWVKRAKITKIVLKEKNFLADSPKLTRFERARIVGARALQISMGAPTLREVSKGFSNPIDIALKELEAGILPITVRRTFPDKSYIDIPLKSMIEEKK